MIFNICAEYLKTPDDIGIKGLMRRVYKSLLSTMDTIHELRRISPNNSAVSEFAQNFENTYPMLAATNMTEQQILREVAQTFVRIYKDPKIAAAQSDHYFDNSDLISSDTRAILDQLRNLSFIEAGILLAARPLLAKWENEYSSNKVQPIIKIGEEYKEIHTVTTKSLDAVKNRLVTVLDNNSYASGQEVGESIDIDSKRVSSGSKGDIDYYHIFVEGQINGMPARNLIVFELRGKFGADSDTEFIANYLDNEPVLEKYVNMIFQKSQLPGLNTDFEIQVGGTSRGKPKEPPKPPEPKNSGGKIHLWLDWCHDMLDHGYKCTLEDVAKKSGYSLGYIKQKHMIYQAKPNQNI